MWGRKYRAWFINWRLVHLSLNPFLQKQFSFFDNLGVDMRAQVARNRIYGLVFLFDPDGESRKHGYGPSGGWLAAGLIPAASQKQLV
jgi:hypothetical protein